MPTGFIAGATGFIGIRVCERLHSLGYEIVALKRPDSDISHIKPYVHKFITADLLSKSCLNDVFSQLKNDHIDYMIALAGTVDYHQSYEEAGKVNVDTTKTIIQIAGHLQKKAGLQKMVFGGSVTSRGFMKKVNSPSEMIDESKDYLEKKISVYCDVKREAEDLINDVINNDKLKAVIVEPGSIIGKGVGNTTTTNIGLIKKIVKGFPVLSGGASYTSLKRAVEGIVLALEKGKIGETRICWAARI